MIGLLLLLACGAPRAPESPAQLPPCGPSERVSPGVELRVRLARGRTVPPDELGAVLEVVRQVWARLGVRLVAEGPAEVWPADHVLAGTRAALEAALAAKGIDPGAPDAGVPDDVRTRVSLEVLAHPLRSFATRHAVPAGAPWVLVLPHVARPGSEAAAAFDRLDGLTVSSDGRGGPEAAALSAWLSASGPMSAIAVVGAADVGAAHAGAVLAHELGHALGLEHRSEAGNLMAPGAPRCAGGLHADQVRQIASALAE